MRAHAPENIGAVASAISRADACEIPGRVLRRLLGIIDRPYCDRRNSGAARSKQFCTRAPRTTAAPTVARGAISA